MPGQDSAKNPATAPEAPRLSERLFSVFVGAFLGGLTGLFLGIGLACFGLTMWLWLVIPLTTAALGAVIGIRHPIDLDEDPQDAPPSPPEAQAAGAVSDKSRSKSAAS